MADEQIPVVETRTDRFLKKAMSWVLWGGVFYILNIWGYVCIRKLEVVDMPQTMFLIVLAIIGGKSYDKFVESKTPK
jgi:uncharacterized membrane protein